MAETEIFARLDEIKNLVMSSAKRVLTLDECAVFTGLSKSYLYTLTSTRKIPHYKQGRILYFEREEVERWMLSRKVETSDEIEHLAAKMIAARS